MPSFTSSTAPTRDVVQLFKKRFPAGVGIIYDYNIVRSLDIDASKDHPEFLSRLIRLLGIQRCQGDCQSDGLCILLKDVRERVRAIKSALEGRPRGRPWLQSLTIKGDSDWRVSVTNTMCFWIAGRSSEILQHATLESNLHDPVTQARLDPR